MLHFPSQTKIPSNEKEAFDFRAHDRRNPRLTRTLIATIYNGDILEVDADALIYSTNVMLNCTGGVGGALMMRYGPSIQQQLHATLNEPLHGPRFATQGDVIRLPIREISYAEIFHTVPCDALYRTTPEIVEAILHRCLSDCEKTTAIRSIALSALGCGYGDFDLEQFLRSANQVFQQTQWPGIDSVTIAIPDVYFFKSAQEQNETEQLAYHFSHPPE